MPNAWTAGQPSPPITAGAWNQAMRSTRSARSSAAASCPPPSTRIRVSPAAPSAVIAAFRSTPAVDPGTSISFAPRSAKASSRARSVPSRSRNQVGISRGGGHQARGQRRAQMAVGHDAHDRRRPEAGDAAGQVRIVGQDGADADHHRVVPAAQGVGQAARRRAGDPLALAGMRGDAAVQRGGQLQRDHRAAERDAVVEAGQRFERPRLPARPVFDLDAGGAQLRQSLAVARAGPDRVAATTTRATPAAISASVQGGVRPQWQQGSSVT